MLMKKKLLLLVLTGAFLGVLSVNATEAHANVTAYGKNGWPTQYNGSYKFNEGRYTNGAVGSGGTWKQGTYLDNLGLVGNDTIYSIDVSPGYRIIITDDHNYKSSAAWFERSISEKDLINVGLKNKVSSLIVENISKDPKDPFTRELKPVIYDDHGFSGTQQMLNVGDYRKRNLSIGNDKVSGIRVPAGYTVQLWDDDNYKDNSRVFKGPAYVPFLNDFNDKTSSLKVWKN